MGAAEARSRNPHAHGYLIDPPSAWGLPAILPTATARSLAASMAPIVDALRRPG